MKLSGGGGADTDMLGMPVVDSLLMNAWNNNNNEYSPADVRHFLITEDTKLTLGDADVDDSIDQKPNIDLDDLLLSTTTTTTTTNSHSNNNINNNNNNNSSRNNNNVVVNGNGGGGGGGAAAGGGGGGGGVHTADNTLAELKPLPPFTGYTGHLSINGISGHHYHTIAAAPNSTRVLVEPNNNTVDTANHNSVAYFHTNADHVVSSSTMDPAIDSNKVVDYGLPNEMDDEFALIIGSGLAEPPTQSENHCDGDSGDSWLDLDSWIQNVGGLGSSIGSTSPTSSKLTSVSCTTSATNGTHHPHHHHHHHNNHHHHHRQNTPPTTNSNANHTNKVMCADQMQDFVTNSQFGVTPTPSQMVGFHSQIKTQQVPPPQPPPPQQQQQQQQSHHHSQQQRGDINTTFPHMPLLQSRLQNGPPKQEPPQDMGYGMECTSPSSSTPNPYLAHSPPCHVVSTSDIGYIQVHSSTRPSPELQSGFPHTTTPSKKSRSRTKSKITSNIIYSDGNLGKEKTVHRCSICNRGFLNKSNIKVHLRTHTGEKPFRCEVCGKAFRQKAHLLKHAQIHKRVGRD